MLDQVRIREFRNLKAVDVELAPGTNWLVGVNASGKTAFLEALYCLSRGRSFRGRRFGSLVSHGASGARVVARVERHEGMESVRWSSRRERAEGARASERFPVRLICDWTHALVDGDPALRRRFVDWNLRLWEPGAAATFAWFRRLSLQRNAWLRSGGRGKRVWDQAYAEGLAALAGQRVAFFRELAVAFGSLTGEEHWFEGLRPQWEGLEADAGVIEARLAEMLDGDRARGFTYLGSSRADYSFRLGLERWAGSRGEGKVVGTLMQVAAERVVSERRERRSLWLVDDLDAELSPEWRDRLLNVVRREAPQLVVTALRGKLSVEQAVGEVDRMFHVEQGRVREGAKLL